MRKQIGEIAKRIQAKRNGKTRLLLHEKAKPEKKRKRVDKKVESETKGKGKKEGKVRMGNARVKIQHWEALKALVSSYRFPLIVT
jgi:hypothetical protein